jgi:hypothetical protein
VKLEAQEEQSRQRSWQGRGIEMHSSAYQQLAILKFPWLYGFGEKFYGYWLRNYKFTNSGKLFFKRKKKRFEQNFEAYAK